MRVKKAFGLLLTSLDLSRQDAGTTFSSVQLIGVITLSFPGRRCTFTDLYHAMPWVVLP